MIRIDEIYAHTFWPWINNHRPNTRLFFCDPFGHTGPEHLYNFGDDACNETQYIFMHDQEPIQIQTHTPLFDDVIRRNADITRQLGTDAPGSVIVSEQGERVRQLERIYGWTSHYYFFHGWACLDWFRGYNRSFLFSKPQYRAPSQKTFMSPNRIIGGERDHRVIFLYHVLKKNLQHNHISAPLICSVENQHAVDIGSKYANRYPDISKVLSDSTLPWLFRGESTQQMTSCWLSNFSEAMQSLIYVPTETVFFDRRTHITEKTFKAIALGLPFVLVAAAGSLEYLRSYGFRTFDSIWDESYDIEADDFRRLEKVTDLLKDIDDLSQREKNQLQKHALPMVTHNWNHFYGTDFENILWAELGQMLNEL